MKWLCLLLFFLATQVQGQETTFNRPAVFPTTEGTYIIGDWKYTFSITSPKTKSQGTWGRLYFKDRELATPRNTVVSTPVGEFLFLGGLDVNGWGEHGWFNTYVDFNGDSHPIFLADGSVYVGLQKLTVKRISGSELLNLNKDSAYQGNQAGNWRTAKIGVYVELNESDKGFLRYRGRVNDCDVIALSTDIGSASALEDLRIYIQKNITMTRVFSLPMAYRLFWVKETDGKLDIFFGDKKGVAPKANDAPAITVDLAQLVQAYGDATPSSKKE